MAREGLKEARRSVRALRPPALEQKPLPDAFGELLGKMTANTSLRVELVVDGTSRKLESKVEDNLLRIGQEALTNVLRHARARRFTAGLAFEAKAIHLTLKD